MNNINNLFSKNLFLIIICLKKKINQRPYDGNVWGCTGKSYRSKPKIYNISLSLSFFLKGFVYLLLCTYTLL